MNIARRIIPVLVLAVGLLVFFQLIRMNILVSPSSLTHETRFENNNVQSWLSDSQKEILPRSKFLLLSSQNQESEVANIELVLKQMGFIIDIFHDNQVPESYDGYDAIIFLQRTTLDYPDWPRLIDAVNDGKKLLYLGNGTFGPQDILRTEAKTFGIVDYSEVDTTSKIFFNSELLSGITGLLDLTDKHYDTYPLVEALDVMLQPQATVYLESEAGNPLIWNQMTGLGSILVMNTGRYETKEIRGMMNGTISEMLGTVAYPIINAEVVFIDDFPADYNAEPAFLRENYNRSMKRFILEIWWPDMKRILDKHAIKPTGAFIESYNDNVVSPFIPNENIKTTTEQLATSLISDGGEIAMHGYNHQPLMLEQKRSKLYDYKAWPSEQSMTLAISTSINTFKSIYPNYELTTYVPPSNLMEEDSIESLAAAIPNLKTISGVYFNETDEWGEINPDVFAQEFQTDSRFGVSLPRATSQGILSESMKFDLASVVTTNGIISHFFHPDDILDPDRSNGLLWEDLSQEADHLFEYFDHQYGWLTEMTASQATEKLIQAENATIYSTQQENKLILTADGWSEGLSVMLFTPKQINQIQGGEMTRIDSLRYLIIMNQSSVTLEVE